MIKILKSRDMIDSRIKQDIDKDIITGASISKTFTSMAMMKLQDEKKLNIDVPINQYLPYI